MNRFEKANAREKFGGMVRHGKQGLMVPVPFAALAEGAWRLLVRDIDGNVVDERIWENLVTTQGKNYLLDAGLDDTTRLDSWYVFLISATPTPAAGDTFASHAGWTEITAYDESTRPAWTAAAASNGVKTNGASAAEFTISTNGTSIGGAGLGSVATKGSGSGSDILYAVGAFDGGNITLNDGSTLEVTAAMSL